MWAGRRRGRRGGGDSQRGTQRVQLALESLVRAGGGHRVSGQDEG